MSCYTVSKHDIALLAEACFPYEVTTPDGKTLTPDMLGQRLWNENYASVNARYEETHKAPAYRHNAKSIATHVRKPLCVYKQVRHYVYQSCEHDNWEASYAAQMMTALAKVVCAQLSKTPEEIQRSTAYQDLPWGLT